MMSLRKMPLAIWFAALGAVALGVLHAALLPSIMRGDPWVRRSRVRDASAQATMLVGAGAGLLVGLLAQSVVERARGGVVARIRRARWRDARRVSLARASGPVEVSGRIRVLTHVTSRMELKACAAYAVRQDLGDGGVKEYAAVGELELRAGRGGVAYIAAGPCEIALPMPVGQYEQRVEDGARVVVCGIARTDADGRIRLTSDDDRPLLLIPDERDAPRET
jgi:hypothetical protein